MDPRLVFELKSWARGCRVILEPGAGLGVVTAALSDVAGSVLGVELDNRLLPVLREVSAEHAKIDIVNADVLELNARRFECIVGNPPYSITGPFLSKIVTEYQPRFAALTLQKEVAERLASKPGSSMYGRITVLVQAVYSVKLGGYYPPRSFYPSPDVASRVVVLEIRERLPSKLLRRLEEVSRCLFSERRKKASKIVRKCCGRVPHWLDGEKRVYELEPREVLRLAIEGCRD